MATASPVQPVDHPEPPGLPQEFRMMGQDLTELRQEVADLLGRGNRGFPGAQPVSFARRHLQELQRQDYYVCEKSDGIRCLMYLTADVTPGGPKEVAYLIDRRNDYFQIQGQHFPRPENENNFWTRTIIDGELVNDRERDGSVVMRFIVFDCLVIDGQVLQKRTLDKRLAYFRERVFTPYEKLYAKYPEERQQLPFVVGWKEMQVGYATEMMFRTILPKLKHGNDGLIFTCRQTPYTFGTDQHILKWKPPQENSIDFKLLLDVPLYEPDSDDEASEPYPNYDWIPNVKLAVNGDGDTDVFYGELYLTDDEWKQLAALEEPLHERIAECYFDEEKRWRIMRFRDDKKSANHISTVESVIGSIQEAVTMRDLIKVAGVVRRNWKTRNEQAQQQR